MAELTVNTASQDKESVQEQETAEAPPQSTVDTSKEIGNADVNKESNELSKKITRQIEYYFGDYNLPRDKFLSEKIQEEDGWIAMDVMHKFKRLSELSVNNEVIFKSLETSDLIEVNEAEKKIRRSPEFPLPLVEGDLKEATIKRTIYCKGFPRDGSIDLDFLLEYFKQFGTYETVHMRHFFDKSTKKYGFKGSVLVVYHDEGAAKEFMKLEDVQHKKLPILRKWHADYLAEKKSEFEERKARKEARKDQLDKETDTAKSNMEPLPKGTFLHVSGFTNVTTREDIKSAILGIIDDLAFIDFKRGDTEGFLRLAAPNSNKLASEALQNVLKVNDADITVRVVEGDEEDEQLKKAQEAKLRAFAQGGNKRKRQGGRGGGGGGRHFKRSRN